MSGHTIPIFINALHYDTKHTRQELDNSTPSESIVKDVIQLDTNSLTIQGLKLMLDEAEKRAEKRADEAEKQITTLLDLVGTLTLAADASVVVAQSIGYIETVVPEEEIIDSSDVKSNKTKAVSTIKRKSIQRKNI
jgi:hypothetical protein